MSGNDIKIIESGSGGATMAEIAAATTMQTFRPLRSVVALMIPSLTKISNTSGNSKVIPIAKMNCVMNSM